MSTAIVGGSYMPVDRWMVFVALIKDVRSGIEDWSMTAVRREWSKAIRSYQMVLKNGYVKQVEE